MIEVYVALSLLSLGYLFNQNKSVLSNLNRKIDPGDIPSQNSLHESNHTETVRKIEADSAKRTLKESYQDSDISPRHPNKSQIPHPQVVNFNHRFHKNDRNNIHEKDESIGPQMVYSQLLGKMVRPDEFVHNNMIPFIKSRNAQSTNPEAFQNQLERFTGVSEHYKPKRETPNFFTPQKDVGNVYGAKHAVDFEHERMPVPTAHKNVLPFKQERVGPGLGLGFTKDPTGGFHQYEARDYAMPKTVDELRVKSNPKVTYEGRIIDGQKGTERGKIGRMAKNKVDTYYKQTPDMYLKTTGAFLKEKQNPKVSAKTTHRQETSRPYGGVAYNKGKQERIRSKTKEPFRQQLEGLNKGHANIERAGKGDAFDHGKKNILIYANERDTTTEKTYEGNVTALVKALVAPFDDIFRFNKKEYMVDNPRTYGQVHAQVPAKQPAYDPNDVARTTIKETTLSEAERMNLKGYNKGVAYDPNDVARTTIKETTLNEPERTNLKGYNKGTAYDPNDVARTTVKETTLNEAERMNLKGPVKALVYDPNNIARTTVKETTLNEAERMNLRGYNKGAAYDPNDVARTTIKETTLNEGERMNLRGYNKGVAYDPNDVARTTVKETTLNEDERMNLRGYNKGVAYDPNDVARTTIKETTLHDYENANLKGERKGIVYDPNDVARTTIKETTLHDYENANLSAERKGYVYDPEEKPKTTLRETTDDFETSLNLKGKDKHIVYDPTDVPRTTLKETTADNNYVGAVDGFVENRGEYRDNNYQVKDTHKQYLADNDYMGGVDGPLQRDGYKLAPREVRNTTRQYTSDNDYYGGSQGQDTHRLMSYEDIYNAEIDNGKEAILEGRMPTSEGPKVAAGADAINVDTRQNELPMEDIFDRQFENRERLSMMSQERLPIIPDNLTRTRREYGRIDDRLIDTQIDLNKNP